MVPQITVLVIKSKNPVLAQIKPSSFINKDNHVFLITEREDGFLNLIRNSYFIIGRPLDKEVMLKETIILN